MKLGLILAVPLTDLGGRGGAGGAGGPDWDGRGRDEPRKVVGRVLRVGGEGRSGGTGSASATKTPD